jgi:NAD(P)-dependent dehydrogenase (short-subunit alcohol dehydrogenase family)
MTAAALKGQIVLITGAARGIGAAAAREVVRRGGSVALVGLEPQLLQALAAELGDRAGWREADVCDAAAMEGAVKWAVERFGGLDIVVANAGIARVGSVADIDPADFEAVIEVNLLGVWRTIRAALPAVRERRGHVFIVSSMSAAVRLPLMAAYAAAKAGVGALGDALRLELAREGVTVGVAYLSFIDTDMVRAAFSDERAAPFVREMPSWMTATMTLDRAVPRIVDAIERRKPRVVLPGRAWPVLLCSQLFEPLMRRAVLARLPRQ